MTAVRVSASVAGLLGIAATPKPHKYRARKATVDGITFASKAEASRYVDLKRLQGAGRISGLELQPIFPCVVEGHKVCSYRADFAYVEAGRRVVEDVKGYRTAEYKLKKKLVEALYPGTKIVEVRA